MSLTYHNDPAIKEKAIARCKEHMEADRLVARTYGEESEDGFKGCAIGCQYWDIAQEQGLDWRDVRNRHEMVADAYWPGHTWLSYLEDRIFEGLPEQDRKEWPLRLVNAVPVGVDITPLYHRLMAYMLRNMLPVYFDAQKFPDVAASIEAVAKLHERASGGEQVPKDEWPRVRKDEWPRVRYVAFQAAYAEMEPEYAARASAMAAEDAAAIKEMAAATAYKQIADKLIELLKEMESAQ